MCYKYFVWSGTGVEQVWNGYGTDTQLNITFQVLHSMVWNGIRGLDPELWIGVWIGMCARPCFGPFILSGSRICIYIYMRHGLNSLCGASTFDFGERAIVFQALVVRRFSLVVHTSLVFEWPSPAAGWILVIW